MEHHHVRRHDVPVLAVEDLPGAYRLRLPVDRLCGVDPRVEPHVVQPPQRAEALRGEVLHLVPRHREEGVEERVQRQRVDVLRAGLLEVDAVAGLGRDWLLVNLLNGEY